MDETIYVIIQGSVWFCVSNAVQYIFNVMIMWYLIYQNLICNSKITATAARYEFMCINIFSEIMSH